MISKYLHNLMNPPRNFYLVYECVDHNRVFALDNIQNTRKVFTLYPLQKKNLNLDFKIFSHFYFTTQVLHIATFYT